MFIFSFLKLGVDFIAGRAIALFNMRMQIATFIFDRWRVILPLAILCLSLLYVHALRHQVAVAKSETIVAKKALIAHVEADNAAAEQRRLENIAKAEQGKKDLATLVLRHQSDLTKILAKGKSHETFNADRIDSFRNGLRLAIEREAARLPENDADRIAERDGNADLLGRIPETDTELALCKEAGAVCASDYNFCKGYVDSQQSILGVQNEAN